MHSFTTKDGKIIQLELTIGKCRRILSRLKVDLLESAPQDLVEMLLMKPLLRMDLMWDMVVPEEGLTHEGFDELMTGDVGQDAEQALREELLFFTQSVAPTRAVILERVLTKSGKLIQQQNEMVEKLIDGPEATAAMKLAMEEAEADALKAFGNMSTKLREHSELTQSP